VLEDIFIIQQRIEGQNLQYLKKGTANAVSTTLSFWVKSNKTGTYVYAILIMIIVEQYQKSYSIRCQLTLGKRKQLTICWRYYWNFRIMIMLIVLEFRNNFG
jgi:hypothetical protein